MGDGQAYRDRLTDGRGARTNAAGYVSGGPATGGTDGWYDCDELVNDSTQQHGLKRPCRTRPGPAWTRARCATHNLWYSRGNPNNAERLSRLPA